MLYRHLLPDTDSLLQEEKVTSYLSVRTKDNDSIRASILVMSGNIRNSFQRILDAPVSTRGSRNQSVSHTLGFVSSGLCSLMSNLEVYGALVTGWPYR